MNPFPWSTYGLIIVALLSHGWIGKRLAMRGFFVRCLIGFYVAAIPVGIFANLNAGLIRPYCLASILIGLTISFFDFWKDRKAHSPAMLLALSVIGVFLAATNSSERSLVFKNANGESIFRFNYHYADRASQSTEMLRAKYPGRLVNSLIYPYERNRYHFFNQGAQALAQSLVAEPGLFSFVTAVPLISVFVFLALLEGFWILFGFTLLNLLVGLGWLVVCLSLFVDGTRFQLINTATPAIPAIAFFLLAWFSNNFRHQFFFAAFLSLAGARFIPLSCGLLAGTFVSIFLQKRFKKALPSPTEVVFYVLVFLYNAVTLFSGTFEESVLLKKISLTSYDPIRRLGLYRIWGYWIANAKEKMGKLPGFFSDWDFGGFFSKVPWGSFAMGLFFLVLAVGIFAIARQIIRFRRISFSAVGGFALLFVATMLLPIMPSGTFFFNLLLNSYVFLNLFLWGENATSLSPQAKKAGFICLSLLFLANFVLQYSPVTIEQKNPLNEIALEIPLMTLLAIFLFQQTKTSAFWWRFGGSLVSLVILFHVQWDGLGISPFPDIPYAANYTKMNAFLDPGFRRENFVDEKNVLRVHGYRIGNLNAYDVLDPQERGVCSYIRVQMYFASALGAYLPYSILEKNPTCRPTNTVARHKGDRSIYLP